MKTLKALLDDVRVFNLDTDDELDLESLADIDIDSLLGDGYLDSEDTGYSELNFDDLENMTLDDAPFDFEDDSIGTPDAEQLGQAALGDGGELELDGNEGGEGAIDSDFDIGNTILDDEEFQTDFDDMSQEDADDIADNDPDAAQGSPDFAGEIRTVRGANLVYKRKMDDGNFEELWVYNVGNDIKRETQIRRAILAGTDVDPGQQESQDGQQRADTSTAGNVQFLHIVGLPQ